MFGSHYGSHLVNVRSQRNSRQWLIGKPISTSEWTLAARLSLHKTSYRILAPLSSSHPHSKPLQPPPQLCFYRTQPFWPWALSFLLASFLVLSVLVLLAPGPLPSLAPPSSLLCMPSALPPLVAWPILLAVLSLDSSRCLCLCSSHMYNKPSQLSLEAVMSPFSLSG